MGSRLKLLLRLLFHREYCKRLQHSNVSLNRKPCSSRGKRPPTVVKSALRHDLSCVALDLSVRKTVDEINISW